MWRSLHFRGTWHIGQNILDTDVSLFQGCPLRRVPLFAVMLQFVAECAMQRFMAVMHVVVRASINTIDFHLCR